MKELFEIYPYAMWSIVSGMVAMVVMVALWEKIKWWWMNTSYSFPIFGGITRLSKDLNRDQKNGWFKSELALCRDYKTFINIQDEHDYNEKVAYIVKSGDSGKHATPKLMWVLISAMVFVEAMGFSYVLAGYTIPGASENMQKIGAYGIAFLISVLLVYLTHASGHELYRSGKIKRARREWGEDGRKHKFTTKEVALAMAQDVDDNDPPYTQVANRVGTHPSFHITIATTIFVVIVAFGATYVRGQVLEQQLHQQTVGASSGAAGSDPYSQTLPDADAASQSAADNKAQDDGISIERHGGWGTFIVLAVIFAFLQFFGGLIGYRWGFAGRESADAYRAIRRDRYTSYSDVREHYKRIGNTAQAKLEQLQQRLMARNAEIGTDGLHTTNTFFDFIQQEHDRETGERTKELERQAVRRQERVAQQDNISAKPAVQAPRSAQTTAPSKQESGDSELDRLRQQVAMLEQKKQAETEARKHDEIAALKARLAELDSQGAK